MPRPGFVLEVDERTPPLLVHEGEGFRMQSFPLGTRVVYPPDPLSAASTSSGTSVPRTWHHQMVQGSSAAAP